LELNYFNDRKINNYFIRQSKK